MFSTHEIHQLEDERRRERMEMDVQSEIEQIRTDLNVIEEKIVRQKENDLKVTLPEILKRTSEQFQNVCNVLEPHPEESSSTFRLGAGSSSSSSSSTNLTVQQYCEQALNQRVYRQSVESIFQQLRDTLTERIKQNTNLLQDISEQKDILEQMCHWMAAEKVRSNEQSLELNVAKENQTKIETAIELRARKNLSTICRILLKLFMLRANEDRDQLNHLGELLDRARRQKRPDAIEKYTKDMQDVEAEISLSRDKFKEMRNMLKSFGDGDDDIVLPEDEVSRRVAENSVAGGITSVPPR